MTRCRAKMIDGSRVTFEHHDRGLIDRLAKSDAEDVYAVELIGEGFHVWSEVSRWASHPIDQSRNVALCHHLERSGVDTATVEYRTENRDPTQGVLGWWWTPLFPPVLREEPASINPGILTYMRTPAEQEVLRLSKMLSAECAMTKELQRRLQDRAEPTWLMTNAGAEVLASAKYRDESMRETLAAIWRAMEKAR